jgi:hydroxypyruvate isomerase
LLFPDEWAAAADAGLIVSMGYASRRDKFIATGFNDPANHALLLGELEMALPRAAQARVSNLIAMFGNRVQGIDESAAIANCVAGLAKIAPLAEKYGVTVCVELLNSKVDHPGYQGDHTAFGVAVMRGVNSPRVKLLYDIYHMQIMEGDLAPTIKRHFDRIAHIQLADNPGRNEPGTGEINYPFLFRYLDEIGYRGWVGCEYKPKTSTMDGMRWHIAATAAA